MPANIPQAVGHLIAQYRRFLRTSFRFLDPELRTQFEQHLHAADIVVRGPYVTLARDFVQGEALDELIGRGAAEPELSKLHWAFGRQRLFRHQARAFEIGRAGRSFVVTTGTGSGKTEAFLLPVLDGILRRKRQGVRGVQAILLYPMNALANDQLERLRRMLRASGVDLSIGLYTGDSDASSRNLREAACETERVGRDAIRRSPPDLLLTNYKQLEFLLVRKADRAMFTPALRYLVLDEVHTYRGALATEIACLIRRLKAHAGLNSGELLGIGTSATVASGSSGPATLAQFASTLFAESFAASDVVTEDLVPLKVGGSWSPRRPYLKEEDTAELDVNNDADVVALAERLTGKSCPAAGAIAERVASVLDGNRLVEALEKYFATPSSVAQVAAELRREFSDRRDMDEAASRLEVEAYLLVGSVGDDEHRPRLRPKLHTFFHGIYDVSLCLDPQCRALVPQGGSQCTRCGSAARPAALCRTCGQDFVKVRYASEDDDRPDAYGEFASDETTAFWTHGIHDLPEKEEEGEEAEDGSADDDASAQPASPRSSRAREKFKPIGVCTSCGRTGKTGGRCSSCSKPLVQMLERSDRLSTCPACGDTYTRGDIVTPLRTGTASTVSVLTTHHLDQLAGDDRKLLVFADNRQDVAHQAGYLSDKQRAIALRHSIAKEVEGVGSNGLSLSELPGRLLDRYRALGLAPKKATRVERDTWLHALRYLAVSEFTRYTRQRQALETLGLIAVDYEFLDDLRGDARFGNLASDAELEPDRALLLARAILDVMRRNRAVSADFLQKYLDPNKDRRLRDLESDPYNLRFPERDRMPRAFALARPDHIRKSQRLLGFFQENPKASQLTAVHRLAARVIGDRARSQTFITGLVPLLEQHQLLEQAANFPIPAKEKTSALRPLQVAERVVRIVARNEGYRCNACRTWRAYDLGTCPTPKCAQGVMRQEKVADDDYYVNLYRERNPQRLSVAEHSAQIGGEERARRETDFKDGRLDVLVCSPTLELGVDIGPLLTVVLRNAPPTPANYAQRVGRAGRRLRIGFVSTFCAAGSHDRHAFEHPDWLIAGRFDPPRLRLDNARIVRRHMHSHILECLSAELPSRMGDLLDDLVSPTAWLRERVDPLFEEVRRRRAEITGRLAALLESDRASGRTRRFDRAECESIVDGLEVRLVAVLEAWWQRVRQLDKEHREFSSIGSPRHDLRKANARRYAYKEITSDHERAYTLNYLSTRDLLPAYQFPLDTFSLDPGVDDTPTLFRPASIALEEFAPGNFVYANGHKLQSIRVLFAGGPGSSGTAAERSDAEASGRLRTLLFCGSCDEVAESVRNDCARCRQPLTNSVNAVFVSAFEAEENLRIGSEEESRQRRFHLRRESLIVPADASCSLYEYPIAPVEYVPLARVLVTNFGQPSQSANHDGERFWLCPDCGRHSPWNPNDPGKSEQARNWDMQHRRYCSGKVDIFVLAYDYQADCIVLTVPTRGDFVNEGPRRGSATLTTLGEALVAATSILLELEPFELGFFCRPAPEGSPGDQIVIYENVPGGAGYVEDLARRLPEVAQQARELLFEHECSRACYLCLKHYRNQRAHALLDKDLVRDVLLSMAQLETLQPKPAKLGDWKQATQSGVPPTTYTKGAIEEPLLHALSALSDLPPARRDHECFDGSTLITVPDFAWPDVRVAVYCDGYQWHGTREALEKDARKRNWLQAQGWTVLVYWGRSILKNPSACAAEIRRVHHSRAAQLQQSNSRRHH